MLKKTLNRCKLKLYMENEEEDNLKILHVVNTSFVLPYFIGDQFDYFHERGYEIYVGCTPSKHLKEYTELKNIQVLEIKVLREINFFEDLRSVYKLYRFIKNNNIKNVIGHTPKGALLAMTAAYLAKVRNRVYFRHGLMYETSSGFKRRLLLSIEKFTGKLAHTVVCVSPSVLNISNEEKLSDPAKNIILGRGTCTGIDTKRFFNTEDQSDETRLFTVGFVGRLVKDKGIVQLVEAWKLIVDSIPEIQLLLVGPLEDRDRLPEDIIHYINNEKTIIYAGLVEDAVPYYRMMDVYILPSFREGFPTSILEASSMKLPVITTRVTGCIDAIIPNITGLFVDNSANDIAEKIKFYFFNQETRRIHGENGRQFVLENFTQEKVWLEIEKKVLKNE